MVFIVVKGTNYPDEFVVERALTDPLSSSASSTASPRDDASTAGSSPPAATTIVPAIAHILNQRHHVRLMLMSAQELLTLLLPRQHTTPGDTAVGGGETPDRAGADDEEGGGVARRYQALIDALHGRLKDTASPVSASEFDDGERELRSLTTLLCPSLCTHADGPEAAVQQLYAKYDDPELDEDTRLVVYHCRALLDPEWKANERVGEEGAALWFCGKPMEATLAKYCGRNAKSKVIVKVAPRSGPAPSGEPRMRYEDQRALYHAACQRREVYKGLEDSELRDRVVQQSRGTVRLSASGAAAVADSAAPTTLRTSGLRPIFAHKEEREVSIS
ncbi:hypothetical protein NESM_000746600 [Novymonas esmeraldas]|uniref:Uncharacterized protein n=1 Tax=Novymonas esmeraldas TaxID=1808958 RepID=A0AAW0EXP1_9TRYP